MNVGELCNREVVIACPEDSIIEVARRMRDHHVGDVIVVADSNGHNEPVGIVTDRDLVVRGVAEAASLDTMRVADVMVDQLVVAGEREDVATILKRMRAHGVRRMPVVDDDAHLAGILTYDDLVEWVTEQMSDLIAVVQHEQWVEQSGTRG
jgi:CBS domain-containing protein